MEESEFRPVPLAAHGTHSRALVCTDICTEGCAEIRERQRATQRAWRQRNRDPLARTRNRAPVMRTEQLVPVTADMLLGAHPPRGESGRAPRPAPPRRAAGATSDYEGRREYLRHLEDTFK